MNVYERFKALNKRLVCGDKIYFGQRAGDSSGPYGQANADRVLSYPKIGIYTGAGASHSWLWFVEIFDRMGFYDLSFLTENHIKVRGLDSLDVLAMSGGDTFAIAKGLGQKGAEGMESFIRGGGLYLGSCAGAYLPMNSSKNHLNLFNFVPVKIANLTKALPDAGTLKEKFCTPYGCSYIFHPVRETVRLATNGFVPFLCGGSLLAPLYGGPPMIASDTSQVLATYSGFTDKTLFLVDEKIARDTLLGKAAVIREKMGAGHLYLFGPHFEHPHFPVANQLLADAMYWDVRGGAAQEKSVERHGMNLEGKDLKNLLRDIKREISNSRIVAVGMENAPVRWTIGNKIYEPAKIREFIEAIWQRIKPLEKLNHLSILPEKDALMIQYAKETTALLRDIKRGINEEIDTRDMAKDMFRLLNKTCTIFLDMYFRSMLDRFRYGSELTLRAA